MVNLGQGYIGSSCVIKTKNNELITLGVLQKIGSKFIDIGSSRNELPSIYYNLLVKVEIYNTREGFRVLIGRTYLSSPKLARITDLNEAISDERREYFRISVKDKGVIYSGSGDSQLYDDNGEAKDLQGIKVQLVDISLGGLLFCTLEQFRMGDRFTIVIPAMGDSVLYTCEVRRKIDRPEGDFGYGCEFIDMSIQQEDLLYRYILRRQRDQLRRMR